MDSCSKKAKHTVSSKKGKFFCDICDVHCPNESTLQQHNSGRKHQSNLKNVKKRDDHTMKSLFVGNLPKFAVIQSQMLSDSTQTPGKEYEKLKLDLMSLFGNYGEVKKIILDKSHGSYCIIEYSSPTMAQTALLEYQKSNIPLLYGKKLQIKARKSTQIQSLSISKSQFHPEVSNIQGLLEEADGDDEFGLSMVDSFIKMSEKCCALRHAAIKRLQDQLNKNFPFHKISLEPYGSFATGLALSDSDLDLSLTFQSSSQLDRNDLVSVLKQKCVGVSHVHVLPAPTGKLTRFLDGISNTTCDIVFSNPLGVANTALIKTILSYDKSLPRLVRILTLWNKIVVGSKFPKSVIPSSYALTIMVFHCLVGEKLLPSFFTKELSQKLHVYDLDCSYITNISSMPGSSISSNMIDLLTLFFKYYGHIFDKEAQVVQIRSVDRVEKKSILADNNQEDKGKFHYVTKFKDSPLAVQDPFVLTHNLASNVSLECAIYFSDQCRLTLRNIAEGVPLSRHFLCSSPPSSSKDDAEVSNESNIAEDNDSLAEDGVKVFPKTGNKRSLEAMDLS